MMKKFDMYRYAIRYWMEGDEWTDAKQLAYQIVYGFKKRG